jgi:hypothetical protein
MGTQFSSQIDNPGVSLGDAYAGQWGFRLGRDSATSVRLDPVGPTTGVFGTYIPPDTVMPVIDLSTYHAMDLDGLNTGATVFSLGAGVVYVYWCNGGDFAGALGFSATSPSQYLGEYVLGAGTAITKSCLFIGMVYNDGTNAVIDLENKRYVWNFYNRHALPIAARPGYNDNNAATTFSRTLNAWGTLNAGTNDAAKFLSWDDSAGVLMIARFTLGAAAPAAVVQCGISAGSTTSPGAAGSFANAAASGTTLTVPYAYGVSKGLNTAQLLCYTANLATTFQADQARNGATADPCMTCLEGIVWG